MVKQTLQLLRPHQWVKNTFIFLPMFFDKHLLNGECWILCIFAFFAFCFAASGIYCLNDIVDSEADKLHPTKCNRPIASGAISKTVGYAMMLICFAMSFAILFCGGANKLEYGIIGFYIILNLAYCIHLKHQSIIDIIIISVGFVLRLLIGGVATGIWLSHWIILMTFLLALFLAIAKRRDDVIIFEKSNIIPRSNINRYSSVFLNQLLNIVATLIIVCYIMYTISPEVVARVGTNYLYLTTIFVLAGIIRYLQVTLVDKQSGSPTMVLLHDRFIHCCLLGWIVSFTCILYL